MTAVEGSVLANFRDLIDTHTLEEYGRFQQHIVLLEDRRRLAAYLEALTSTVPGDVVVDVGAGTGILGILALRLGYEHAFLIEPSKKMALYARHLAELNGVLDRVAILTSTLETLRPSELPAQIDLVGTETLSSLLFGFGSWDALPTLAGRLRRPEAVIPFRGELRACLATHDYATRGCDSAGLGLLKTLGIKIDLFERTFRSGGNVYDKRVVASEIQEGTLISARIADFDFSRPNPITRMERPSSRRKRGITLAHCFTGL